MRPQDHVVPLKSVEGARIIEELRDADGITVLVGSAASSFAPTCLPAGTPLAKAIAARLVDRSASNPEVLKPLLEETAFEHVMERCPDAERIRGVLSARFRDVPSNPVYRALARLAAAGVVRHIVTTNYDVGIEAAFTKAAPSTGLALVRGEREAPNAAGNPPHVLFKVHGCATVEFASEMVFRLRDEAQLPSWKRETLGRLVAGRPLVVAAYSGMDFEICPELAKMGASRLVWLQFDPLEKMTANAWRVVRESGGIVLLGSIQALAGALLGESEIEAEWAPASADRLAADLFARFDETEVDAWRARLFGEIGCGADAVAAADRLLEKADGDAVRGKALSLRGRGQFHRGRYLDGAEDYARAARLFRRSGDAEELRGALNGVAECNRCAGRFGRVFAPHGALWWLAFRARGTAERGAARADALMLGVLLRRHAYQAAGRLPHRWGLRHIRDGLKAGLRLWARRSLSQVALFAADAGNWLQLQQTELWSGRYDLRPEDIHTGPMSPLPSESGYGQLGYFVARVMAVRDALDKAGPAPVEVEEAKQMLNTLWEIGAAPEAWKLAQAIMRRWGTAAVDGELRARVLKAREQCQYTRLMRFAMKKGFG